MAAQTIMYEGRLNGGMSYANSVLSAAGTVTQANINGQMTMYNAEVNADQVLHKGQSDYSKWQSQDNQNLTSGILKGASTYYGGSLGSSSFGSGSSGVSDYSTWDSGSSNLMSGMFGSAYNGNDSAGLGRYNTGSWDDYGSSLLKD